MTGGLENAGIVGAFSGSLLVQGTYIALARLVANAGKWRHRSSL